MQEPGRRTTRPFAGVDLRRPKGYPASTPATAPVEAAAAGDPVPAVRVADTKFCYFNNYNTSQPRHLQSCRRYWTKGGSLRNPGGGGFRKSHSSSAAPKNPKRSKNSKRRRVAPAPEPAPSTDASTATDADAAQTEAATKGTAGDTAAPPAADGGFTDPSVALGLSLTDASGKELSDPSPFEWPSGCELGSYWATGVFADTDPELFLNLP